MQRTVKLSKQIRHDFDELQLVRVIHAIQELRNVGVSEKSIQVIKDELKLN